ncbi:hypothetical protein [Streptomyces yanii]|uniref:Uncharacterized protein n=1 Tax=Streptomyces yanii TaxID=78510 RepID=A0ABV5R1F8_9ACTN
MISARKAGSGRARERRVAVHVAKAERGVVLHIRRNGTHILTGDIDP